MKLSQTCGVTGYKMNLHVLQGHEHPFDHGRTIKQLLEVVIWKAETWVHVVKLGPLRYDASITFNAFLLDSLRIHVILTTLAHARMMRRKII